MNSCFGKTGTRERRSWRSSSTLQRLWTLVRLLWGLWGLCSISAGLCKKTGWWTGLSKRLQPLVSRWSCVKYFRTGSVTPLSSRRRPVEDVFLFESSIENSYGSTGELPHLILWVIRIPNLMCFTLFIGCWAESRTVGGPPTHPLWSGSLVSSVVLHLLSNLCF